MSASPRAFSAVNLVVERPNLPPNRAVARAWLTYPRGSLILSGERAVARVRAKKGQAATLAEPPFRHRTCMGAGIAGEALPAAATTARSWRPRHRASFSFAELLRTQHLGPHRGARFVWPGRRLVHVYTVLCNRAR